MGFIIFSKGLVDLLSFPGCMLKHALTVAVLKFAKVPIFEYKLYNDKGGSVEFGKVGSSAVHFILSVGIPTTMLLFSMTAAIMANWPSAMFVFKSHGGNILLWWLSLCFGTQAFQDIEYTQNAWSSMTQGVRKGNVGLLLFVPFYAIAWIGSLLVKLGLGFILGAIIQLWFPEWALSFL